MSPDGGRVLRLGLVAGEPSGDRLGAALMRELQGLYQPLHCIGAGGPAMRAAGLDCRVAAEDLGMHGLLEPMLALPRLLRSRRTLLSGFTAAGIDAFVGIDFNGFNLQLERRLKRRGIPTCHYVSPSIYAWRPGRLRGFAKAMDQVLTLFPFEPALYRDSAVDAVCVGHPLARELRPVTDRLQLRAELGLPAWPGQRLLALLPGSRAAERRRLLPDFIAAAVSLRQQGVVEQVAVAAVDAAAAADLRRSSAMEGAEVAVLVGRTHDLLAAADLALVKAGTGTLEAMLLGTPMVVAYRSDPLTAAVVRRLLRTPWVALPNILAGETLVPELLQEAVTAPALAAAMGEQWARRRELVTRFAQLAEELREGAETTPGQALMALLQRRRVLPCSAVQALGGGDD